MKAQIETNMLNTGTAASGAGEKCLRFLKACHLQPVDRPPMWLMRQAGRALPEYRRLKEKYSFLQLVQTPELAAEVTLQPIRRFDFDAAILFSDILVVCEALGQGYSFREGGGIQMEFAVRSQEEIGKLESGRVREHLGYEAEAIALIRKQLGRSNALIGFAGAPWTLANFMMEGGSSDEFTKAKGLFYEAPEVFEGLMEKLTAAVLDYLELQIEAGVDAVQIFDSLAGSLAGNIYEAASGAWIRRIVKGIAGRVPVIVFARGANGIWDQLSSLGADILSVDWTVQLAELRSRLPAGIGIQGNLDPYLLQTTPGAVERETLRILREMEGRPGHIFNLGHGLPPNAKLENIESLVNTVRSYSCSN